MCATMFDTCVGFGLRVARTRPRRHTHARDIAQHPARPLDIPLLHLFTTPLYHTSLLHLFTTPLYYTSLLHLFATPQYYTSLLHLFTTPQYYTSWLHLFTTHTRRDTLYYILLLHLFTTPLYYTYPARHSLLHSLQLFPSPLYYTSLHYIPSLHLYTTRTRRDSSLSRGSSWSEAKSAAVTVPTSSTYIYRCISVNNGTYRWL
jgi:hypothetical protein